MAHPGKYLVPHCKIAWILAFRLLEYCCKGGGAFISITFVNDRRGEKLKYYLKAYTVGI